jgi:hypothetical protein
MQRYLPHVGIAVSVGIIILCLELRFGVRPDLIAQFLGAFTAAIVAAGALVLSKQFESDAAIEREERSAHRALTSDVIELHAWLGKLISAFGYVAGRAKQQQGPMPSHEIRLLVRPQLREELNKRIAVAAKITAPLGGQIVRELHQCDNELSVVAYLEVLPDDLVLTEKNLVNLVGMAEKSKVSACLIRAQIGRFLQENGATDSLDGFDMWTLIFRENPQLFD